MVVMTRFLKALGVKSLSVAALILLCQDSHKESMGALGLNLGLVEDATIAPPITKQKVFAPVWVLDFARRLN